MGFNSRYVSIEGMLSAWAADGLEGLKRYFFKPEALHFIQPCNTPQQVYEALKAKEYAKAERMAKKAHVEFAILEGRRSALRKLYGEAIIRKDKDFNELLSRKLQDLQKQIDTL